MYDVPYYLTSYLCILLKHTYKLTLLT